MLHDGAAAEGPHVFTLDAGALAPGVYVLIAHVEDAERQMAWPTVMSKKDPINAIKRRAAGPQDLSGASPWIPKTDRAGAERV